MNWWHLLHDYIKKNYENGRYNQNYNFSHSPTAATQNCSTKKQSSDYNLGCQQACTDYQNHHKFHLYPQTLTSWLNRLFQGRLNEIAAFIKGYNDTRTLILQKNS